MLLVAAGVLPDWPGSTQQVALPPFDLLADVRVLTARAPSPVLFVVGLLLAIGARSVVLASLLGFTRRRWRFAVGFELVAVVPALVAAGLDFSGRAVLYGSLVWAGLAITVLTGVGLGAVPWTGEPRLRTAWARALRNRLRFGVVLSYLVALAVLGALVPAGGSWLAIALVPVSATLTGLAVHRMSIEPAPRPSGRGFAAATGAAALAAALVVVLVVVLLPGGGTRPRPAARDGTLLLVGGVDTASGAGAIFRLDPGALGYTCDQTFYFSYRGPGDGAPRKSARCPIRSGLPYTKPDTTRPLRDARAAFAAQVDGLEPPVVVVAHSQGAWIAWAALASGQADGVTDLVMLGPFTEGLAAYPPSGERGAGALGGAWVRLVTELGRAIGFSEVDADAPLVREMQATPGAIAALFEEPIPRRPRALAVLARLDLPLEPGDAPARVATACPGWHAHGSLPTANDVLRATGAFLERRDPGSCPAWVRALARPATAFGAPPPPA